MQYRLPRNYDLVYEALHKAGRTDLIGYDKHCLIRPKKQETVNRRKEEKKPPRKKKTIRNIHKKKS